MIEELSERIWQRPEFQRDYHGLLRVGLVNSLKLQHASPEILEAEALRRLVQTATHFSGSSNAGLREAAYKIATTTFEMYGGAYDGLQEISSLILGRLGNFPAVDLLFRGDGIDRGKQLPSGLWFEHLSRKNSNSIEIGRSEATFTDFQMRLWNTLDERLSTAVTAPTSAGKSFALQRFIVSLLIEQPAWCLYVVPTRALLNQVSAHFTALFRALEQTNLAVCTVPLSPSELGETAGVYILTQERLQILLESDPNIEFRIAVIDEAQMIGEGGRGVTLEAVVGKLRSRSPKMQFLFGSPQTKNPGIFQSVFGLTTLEVVREQESPVTQNLIFIDTDPVKLNELKVSAMIGTKDESLAKVVLPLSVYDADQTLSAISWFFGKNQQNIVYAGGQARCESIAGLLVT